MTERPVSLAEAATQLGLTPDAVRARVRRGSLHGERRGRQWFITLPATDRIPVATEPAPSTRPHATERPAAALDLVAELRTELSRLHGEVNRLLHIVEQDAVERAELRRLLAAAMPALPAARAPEMADSGPVDVEPTAKPSRHWWQVWR